MIRLLMLRARRIYGKYGVFLCAMVLSCTLAKIQASNGRPNRADLSPIISVSSDLVLLPVHVTDAQGNFVSGLTKENFKVYEERQLQNLTVFQREDTPVSVGLLVDHSASMKSKLTSVTAAVAAFANSGNADDEMFAVDFNDKLNLGPLAGKSFTNSSTELADAAGPPTASGRTALYDAIIAGITHLQLSHLERKALIVISDGGDNASFHDRSDVLKLARQSQVTIYSIIFAAKHGKDENPKALLQLCRDTGGVAFAPQSQESIMEFSLAIARDLRQQYTVGFVPDQKQVDTSFRKLVVRVVAPQVGRVNVRTRRGYFAQNKDVRLFPERAVR